MLKKGRKYQDDIRAHLGVVSYGGLWWQRGAEELPPQEVCKVAESCLEQKGADNLIRGRGRLHSFLLASWEDCLAGMGHQPCLLGGPPPLALAAALIVCCVVTCGSQGLPCNPDLGGDSPTSCRGRGGTKTSSFEG